MKDIVSTGIIKDIKQIIEESKRTVVKNVNTIMLQTYWSIGKRIYNLIQLNMVINNKDKK